MVREGQTTFYLTAAALAAVKRHSRGNMSAAANYMLEQFDSLRKAAEEAERKFKEVLQALKHVHAMHAMSDEEFNADIERVHRERVRRGQTELTSYSDDIN